MTDTSKEAVERTTTPDIEAIRKRAETAAKALDVGGISGAFLCVEPILNDIPALLSHIAALEAERTELMIDGEYKCVQVTP